MDRNYYIFNNGRISRKDNTIFFEGEDKRRFLPLNDINSIFIFGEVDFNSKALNYLSENNITIHLFNYYGFYTSSIYPREYLPSGFSLVNQVDNYSNPAKRIIIAREIVDTAAYNILKNLKYYSYRNDRILDNLIDRIESERANLKQCQTVEQLMGVEGRIRDTYYKAFPIIMDNKFEFSKRVKRPPDNPVNTLISFGNSLMYTTVLSEIYNTQLNPTISYLHEPGERRFSLSLDISEVFKPIVIDRIIFKLINENMISEDDFTKKLNFCHLNDNGKKTFLKEYDNKLNTTIKHKDLDRHVSYRRLIRLECYKLQKHINDIKEYKGLKMWW